MRHHFQLATLLTAAILCASGCNQTPVPKPTTSTPKPAVMDATTRATFTQQAENHPTFKVFLQKPELPTILVVDEATTDTQLKSLLWFLRIQTRDGQLKDLGIKPTTTVFGTPTYISGELAIYRGTRCAKEMYSPGNPCGPSLHKAASYHWGDGGDPRSDSASITSATGTSTSTFVFTADDGFQTGTEAHADPTGALHKASIARIKYATKQNAQSTKAHTDTRFAVTVPDDQLRIISYQLATDAGRETFLKQFLILEQDHLCPLGFKTLQLGALGSPAKSYPIPCNHEPGTSPEGNLK